MKTIYLLLLVLLCFARGTVTAQKYYIAASGGYAFSAHNILGHNYLAEHTENVYCTYGNGPNFGAAFGYCITDYIGIEMGFSYLQPKSHELKSEDPRYPLYSYRTMLNAKMSRLFMSVKITGGNKIKPYVKFGYVYGTGMNVNISNVTAPYINRYNYREGTAPGWFASPGIDFKVSKSIAVFLEGNFLYQNYAPGKVDYDDGSGIVRTYNIGDDVPYPYTNLKLGDLFPFSSISINAGIAFYPVVKKKTEPPAPESK